MCTTFYHSSHNTKMLIMVTVVAVNVPELLMSLHLVSHPRNTMSLSQCFAFLVLCQHAVVHDGVVQCESCAPIMFRVVCHKHICLICLHLTRSIPPAAALLSSMQLRGYQKVLERFHSAPSIRWLTLACNCSDIVLWKGVQGDPDLPRADAQIRG